MSHLSEGRVSDSPYVEMIWRGRAGSAYAPTCPADSRWNLLLLRRGDGKLTVSVEGPLTKAKAKTHAEGTEWLVIKFQLGTFLAALPLRNLLYGEAVHHLVASDSFLLPASTSQFTYY